MDDLEVVERGIALYWKTLASVRGLAYATEREYDYVISENRSGPERILNVRIQDDPEDRLWELAVRIKARELPDSILMTDRARPDLLPRHFGAMGFEIDTSGLCMAMDLARTSLDCTPDAALQLLELTDESRLPQWAHIVNTALFGCELFRPEQYLDLFRLGYTRFYMAKCGGVPVCACMTIFEDDVATLEMVVTLANTEGGGLPRR